MERVVSAPRYTRTERKSVGHALPICSSVSVCERKREQARGAAQIPARGAESRRAASTASNRPAAAAHALRREGESVARARPPAEQAGAQRAACRGAAPLAALAAHAVLRARRGGDLARAAAVPGHHLQHVCRAGAHALRAADAGVVDLHSVRHGHNLAEGRLRLGLRTPRARQRASRRCELAGRGGGAQPACTPKFGPESSKPLAAPGESRCGRGRARARCTTADTATAAAARPPAARGRGAAKAEPGRFGPLISRTAPRRHPLRRISPPSARVRAQLSAGPRAPNRAGAPTGGAACNRIRKPQAGAAPAGAASAPPCPRRRRRRAPRSRGRSAWQQRRKRAWTGASLAKSTRWAQPGFGAWRARAEPRACGCVRDAHRRSVPSRLTGADP